MMVSCAGATVAEEVALTSARVSKLEPVMDTVSEPVGVDGSNL
jgi:hypothetical protein